MSEIPVWRMINSLMYQLYNKSSQINNYYYIFHFYTLVYCTLSLPLVHVHVFKYFMYKHNIVCILYVKYNKPFGYKEKYWIGRILINSERHLQHVKLVVTS